MLYCRCLEYTLESDFNRNKKCEKHVLCSKCLEFEVTESVIRKRKNSKEWQKKNTLKHSKSVGKYHKKRCETDLNFKLAKNLRCRLSCAIKGKFKSGSAVRDLGCSIDKFILWIEMNWTEEMNWKNYREWEFDHIKPLSSFNLEDREEFLEACNFKNIQPLWKIDNLKKSNKLTT